jgi:hypothetical protein
VSKRLDYNQIAPAGAKAIGGVYGYVMQSNLPPVLVDLVCGSPRSIIAPIASICTCAIY